jgi:hypothetical protein
MELGKVVDREMRPELTKQDFCLTLLELLGDLVFLLLDFEFMLSK